MEIKKKSRRPVSAGQGNRKNLTKNKKPFLSACLIVKNEEDFLPRCLASIREAVDEIVLVDTGSDDRTLEIAEEYGCRIFHYRWTGDFSAARNYSLAHAAGEWILVIDADEELPEVSLPNLRKAIRNPDHDIISVSVYNRSLDTGIVSSFLPSVRLFRRDLGLTYRGIVHNRLTLPSERPVVRSAVKLYHYGYDLDRSKLERKKSRTLNLLKKQLEDHPDDIFANFNIAQLLRGMSGIGERQTARKILMHSRKVIDSHRASSSEYRGYRLMSYLQAAQACTTLDDIPGAIAYSQKALEEKPDYLDAMIIMANAHLAEGNIAEAEKYYGLYLETVAKYRPERETSDLIVHYLDARHVAWYGLATAARVRGDIEEALSLYHKIEQNQIEYLDTGYQIACLLLQKGEAGRAEQYFRRQIREDDQSAAVNFGLGQALAVQGRGDHALEYLKKAVALEPENKRARFFLGRTLVELGQIETGIDYVRETTGKTAEDTLILYEGGNLLFEAGDITSALNCYEKCLAACPDHNEALNNLGNCRFRLKDYDKAAETYRKLIDRNPEFVPALRNLGLAEAGAGRHARALDILARYAEKAPEDLPILTIMGDICMALNLSRQAIACYEKYLEHYSEDLNVLLKLSECYWQSGSWEAARAGFEYILKTDPGCELAQKRLELLSEPAGSC